MIQTPGVGFNWDSNSLHNSRMMAQTTSQATTPPAALSAPTVNLESARTALAQTTEHLTVDVSLVTADMSISFSGTASFVPSDSSFSVDLSFLYFDVIVVSSDGTTRSLSSNGMNFSADLGSEQFAMLVSPGSRSGGHGLLGAVRTVTDKLADAAIRAMQVNHDPGAKAQESARREAQAQSLRAALSHATRVTGKKKTVQNNVPAQAAAATLASFAALAGDKTSKKHQASVSATDRYHGIRGNSESNRVTLRVSEDSIKGHVAITRTNDLAKSDNRPGLFLDSIA